MRAPLHCFIKEAASSAIMMFFEHYCLIWKTGIMQTGPGRNEIKKINKKKLTKPWNNYSVKKEGSFYVFYCFLVFFCTKEQIWHTEIHSLVTVLLLLCFLNASSNISRMALEYTQKHTLFLLTKDTLSDVTLYALILSILFLKRTNPTQSVDKSPK